MSVGLNYYLSSLKIYGTIKIFASSYEQEKSKQCILLYTFQLLLDRILRWMLLNHLDSLSISGTDMRLKLNSVKGYDGTCSIFQLEE